MSLVQLLNPATYELCELELCDLSVNQDPPWETKKNHSTTSLGSYNFK